MSTSARHNLLYVPETAYGTTPATPSFLHLSHVGCTLGQTKDVSVSKTQRQNRQAQASRHGTRAIGGDVTCEFMPLAHDDILAAVFCSAWTGTGPFNLKVGSTRQSFSMLRNFQDQQSGDEPFHLYAGCEVNTLGITVDTKSEVQLKVGFMGQSVSTAGTAPTGAVLGAESTQVPFNGLNGSIMEGGSSIAIITGVTLNLENGMEARYTVFNDTTRLPKLGRFTASGSVTALFENSALLKKFYNGTDSALAFTFSIPGFSYAFSVPNIKYNGGQPDTTEQADIVITLPFTASYDPTSDTTVGVVKTLS